MNPWSKWLAGLFRRQTSGGKFIPEIDGLRFVAIAAVVAYHLYGQLGRYCGVRVSAVPARLVNNGDRGVSLFFVISGFILALPFVSHCLRGSASVDLRRYFQRRLTRLEPPYIINLVLCAVLLVLVKHISATSVIPHLLASLFYSHSLLYGSLSAVNPVTWSLEVEVQFYLIMPLLAHVFAIRSPLTRRAFLIAAMLIAGMSQAYWAHTLRSELTLLYYAQFFLAGLLLADLYLAHTTEPAKNWCWDIVSLAGWPLIFLPENGAVLHMVLPFLILVLYWAAFRGRLTNYLFRLPMLTSVGGMCYTIYLYHFLTIAFATRVMGHNARAGTVVGVSAAFIAVVSAALFLLVEKPCMDRNWPKRLMPLVPRLVRLRASSKLRGRVSSVRDHIQFRAG